MKNSTPYRLFITLLTSLALLLAGCGKAATETQASEGVDPAPTSAPAKPATVSSTTGSFFSINAIGLGPNGYIALTNFSDVPASTAGLILCQGSNCFELPDSVIAAGDTGLVSVADGSGLEGVIANHATLGELQPSDGEIAIFTSKNYEDPKAIVVYLQWGSTPHQLTPVAVKAGLWFESSYAPSSANATRLYRIEESGLWLFEE